MKDIKEIKILNDILDMKEYLATKCYCPGEVYSIDGFFYQIFRGSSECKVIGKCEKEDNFLSKIPFIAVISKSTDDIVQILFIMYKQENILDILRFDATENNIKLIKEVIKTGKTELKLNEYEEGKTEKNLEKIFSISNVVLID